MLLQQVFIECLLINLESARHGEHDGEKNKDMVSAHVEIWGRQSLNENFKNKNVSLKIKGYQMFC